MSRMVKKKLAVTDGVNISSNSSTVTISGKLGSVNLDLGGLVSLDLNNGVSFNSLQEKDCGMLGTSYVLVKNAIHDVNEGFIARLKLVGVGFKADVVGKFLRIYIGFSHDIFFAIPNSLRVTVSNDVDITISGNDRTKVMQFAMMVRSKKKPEPYKGKGIFLNGETILRKEGKKK